MYGCNVIWFVFNKFYILKIILFCLQAKEHILVYNWSLPPEFYINFSESSHYFFN
jgi:hypothetical protein